MLISDAYTMKKAEVTEKRQKSDEAKDWRKTSKECKHIYKGVIMKRLKMKGHNIL